MRIGLLDRLPARVTALQPGPVSVQVHMALPGGDVLCAVVTRESAMQLALAPGAAVVALPLAPGVLLSTGGRSPGAETRWTATVVQWAQGPLTALVRLQTDRGTGIHAVLTHAAVAELGLKAGGAVEVGILASHVMLAVPAEGFSARDANVSAAWAHGR